MFFRAESQGCSSGQSPRSVSGMFFRVKSQGCSSGQSLMDVLQGKVHGQPQGCSSGQSLMDVLQGRVHGQSQGCSSGQSPRSIQVMFFRVKSVTLFPMCTSMHIVDTEDPARDTNLLSSPELFYKSSDTSGHIFDHFLRGRSAAAYMTG